MYKILWLVVFVICCLISGYDKGRKTKIFELEDPLYDLEKTQDNH